MRSSDPRPLRTPPMIRCASTVNIIQDPPQSWTGYGIYLGLTD
jgi:hypothetical protein